MKKRFPGLLLFCGSIRTCFFVRDVDVNYAGVVKGRKEEFVRLGLTEKTHYLASTGIQGQIADSRSLVLLVLMLWMACGRADSFFACPGSI